MSLPACSNCGNRYVVRLSSYQVVLCPDCKTETPWPLKPGQQALISSNRGDRKK
jgi:hypothetical protein